MFSTKHNEVSKVVMDTAWMFSRNASKKFGGKTSEYFNIALALTWQFAKVQMANGVVIHSKPKRAMFNIAKPVRETKNFVALQVDVEFEWTKRFRRELLWLEKKFMKGSGIEIDYLVAAVETLKTNYGVDEPVRVRKVLANGDGF